MKQRLIDADAIISFVSAGHLRNPMEKTWSDNDVVDMIESRPTVDAVPVVRCEECKNLGNNDGYYFCNAIGLAFGNKPNWFCADGERRSDGKLNG